LFKESHGKIENYAILNIINCIGFPIYLIIDGIGFVWRVDGDDIFSCGITLSLVEFSLIAERETSLLTTVWTESGRRDSIFLSVKYWRYLFIEFYIFVCDRKRILTVFTHSFFYESFIGWDGVHGEKKNSLTL
jgi:hypothetical protein